MLQPKPKAGGKWLPTQVVYGIDCSDADPEKWTAFGSDAEKAAAKTATQPAKQVARADHLAQ